MSVSPTRQGSLFCRGVGCVRYAYVQLAQAIGITDYDTSAPTLTPLRHISTEGVLRENNMNGAAWVQIDHGKVWGLQKEPSLARGDVEAVMANATCSDELSIIGS